MMPRMGLRVVFGWADVITIFLPTKALTSVDLPTFGRPITATKPARCSDVMVVVSHF